MVVQAASNPSRAASDVMGSEGGASGSLDVGTLLALPGVSRFIEAEVAPEALRDALVAAVDSALDALEAMRLDEGAALEAELLSRVSAIEARAARVESRAGEVKELARERLRRLYDEKHPRA